MEKLVPHAGNSTASCQLQPIQDFSNYYLSLGLPANCYHVSEELVEMSFQISTSTFVPFMFASLYEECQQITGSHSG